jgi:hypothetical protein
MQRKSKTEKGHELEYFKVWVICLLSMKYRKTTYSSLMLLVLVLIIRDLTSPLTEFFSGFISPVLEQ